MRILLFGPNGQVGTEIRQQAAASGVEIVPAGRDVVDLSAPDGIGTVIAGAKCQGVINASAYTAVDKAETEPDLAKAVNTVAPEAMAVACAAAGVPFVHYSTDYVFDGTNSSPYRETDRVSPLGVYGRTKAAGEAAVLAAGGTTAIIRLAWVFSAHGGNFVKTMLRVGPERGGVRVVADQVGKPTPAADAARAGLKTLALLQDDPSSAGLYHFGGDDETSWAGFAEAIFEVAGLDVPVEYITTAEYPTPAARPAYSSLDTTKITQTLGIPAADWRAGLRDVIATLNKA